MMWINTDRTVQRSTVIAQVVTQIVGKVTTKIAAYGRQDVPEEEAGKTCKRVPSGNEVMNPDEHAQEDADIFGAKVLDKFMAKVAAEIAAEDRDEWRSPNALTEKRTDVADKVPPQWPSKSATKCPTEF
jgi:hypothetical protein